MVATRGETVLPSRHQQAATQIDHELSELLQPEATEVLSGHVFQDHRGIRVEGILRKGVARGSGDINGNRGTLKNAGKMVALARLIQEKDAWFSRYAQQTGGDIVLRPRVFVN